jgi:hypothetical protein
VGVKFNAASVFGIPVVVVDVGDAVAAARETFVDDESTAPGDAWVVEPEFCASEASLAALSFFSRATCKSSCKKSSPEDRLRGGFGSFWPEDEERGGTEAEICTGV